MFHLPLANEHETLIRAVGMYLLGQYFSLKSGEEFDANLKGLVASYEELQLVNLSIATRLRESGEIKESELFEEANELLQKMKNMPGMGNIQNMLSKMGLPNLGGKNTKIDINAMQAQLDRNMKMAKQRDRMRQKHATNKEKQSYDSNNTTAVNKEQEEKEATIRKLLESGNDGDIENLIFSTGEKMEKSTRIHSQPNDQTNKKKVKKNKNK